MATAEYMRNYRENNTHYRDTQRKRNAAHSKALRALAAEYPDEFRKFYHKFLKEVGIDEPRTSKPPSNGGSPSTE